MADISRTNGSETLTSIDGALVEANEAFTDGDFARAFTIFSNILKFDGKHPEANYYQALIKSELQGSKVPVDQFKSALRAKPTSKIFWKGYINALLRAGRLRDAEVVLNQALLKGAKEEYFLSCKTAIESNDKVKNLLRRSRLLASDLKMSDAIAAASKALEISPDDFDVFLILGKLHHRDDQPKKAIYFYRCAIRVNPVSFVAYRSLGELYLNILNLKDSIANYKIALSIRPNDVACCNNLGEAYFKDRDYKNAEKYFRKSNSQGAGHIAPKYNLGCLYLIMGNRKKAINEFKDTLKISPKHLNSLNNLGCCYLEEGQFKDALKCFTLALEIDFDCRKALENYASAVRHIKFYKSEPTVLKIIEKVLLEGSLVRPADLCRTVINLWHLDSDVSSILTLFESERALDLHSAVDVLTNLPAFIPMLALSPIPDVRFEKLLKSLRFLLLEFLIEGKKEPKYLQFQVALAKQCYLNEYIYGLKNIEIKYVKALSERIFLALNANQSGIDALVACLGSYRSLSSFEWKGRLGPIEPLTSLCRMQIDEPTYEKSVSERIANVAQELHEDQVSASVKAQYEEHPYPRWIDLKLVEKQRSLPERLNELQLKHSFEHSAENEEISVLVAGCGTGQHSIGVASLMRNSNVLAIDLSSASLAYAVRKAEELGVANVQHLQGNILNLDTFSKTFDIIECGGVLHHMHDPFQGWKILTKLLRPGGFMKIGLYSEIAREHITKIRDEISKCEIDISSVQAIIEFREQLKDSAEPHHKKIQESSDFYSLSTVRDLIFHVQEHLFTIPLIEDYLERLGLVFCGFEIAGLNRKLEASNFPSEERYNLKQWADFEIENPDTFRGMYQFWCQKP